MIRTLAEKLRRLLSPRRIQQNIMMFILMLLFGIIVMNHIASVRQDQTSSNIVTQYKKRQADLQRYEDRYAALVEANRQLNQQKADAIAELLSREGHEELLAELERAKALAGFTEVRGPGVTLVLDDKPGYNMLTDSLESIVHDGDIRHAIDLFRDAGAAAVSVNGARFTNASNILCIGTTIRCNNQRMIPPYVITALGNPTALADAIRNDQEFNIRQTKGIDLVVKITEESEVVIPAFAEADDIEQFIDLLEVASP